VRPAAWCYRAGLRTMVVSRLLTGCMTLGEARHWWNWVRSDRARVLDANWDPDDPWPGRLGELQHLGTLLRDPRYLVGTYVRD
ncbi:MAG: hypothetical protein ABI305_14145, partial [Tepidiformaceae bacterium]